MHRLVLLALAAVACGRDASRPETATAGADRGADQIVLRVPRGGGIARAAVYPALDSIIWEASGVPAINRVLGFDPEAGVLSVVNRAGRPAQLDLRLGQSSQLTRDSLRSLTSANGSDVYGVDSRGRVLRLNPAGSWTFTPPAPARAVFAQYDGAILIAGRREAATVVWRLYPPDDQILDSVSLPVSQTSLGVQTNDRLYLATDTAVIALAPRTLDRAGSVRTRAPVVATVPTPSGDRLYLALENASAVRVIGRFSDAGPSEVELPGEVSDLRMDPLGRYLLARPAGRDSVWVIAVATGQLLGTYPSRWLPDLPTVAPDGAIATLAARDVVFIDPNSGRERMRATGGASEFWVFFHWNGFRPRAPGIDVPVTFPTPDTAAPDTLEEASPPGTRVAPRPAVPAPAPGSAGFTVSFATLLSQERAAALAESIVVGSARARVVRGEAAGVPIYRVVIGSYPSRAEAEAAGRASQRQFWIFEGEP